VGSVYFGVKIFPDTGSHRSETCRVSMLCSGSLGVIGPVGPDGSPGPAGPRGPPGATGFSGPSGPQGGTGWTGSSGDPGQAGETGGTGFTGATGTVGSTGFTGPAGTLGQPGYCTRHLTVSLLHLDTIRYDTRCYFNVRSKADISQLNLPHGTDN